MNAVEIDKLKCKGCDICVDLCPSGALSMIKDLSAINTKVAFVYKEENCTGCNKCELNCPDFAINVTSTKEYKFAKLTEDSKELAKKIKDNNYFIEKV